MNAKLIFKMASGSKRSKTTFTLEETAEICPQSGSDAGSDIDSSTGGMSSGEEYELDEELLNASQNEADLR